jgi:hypothetical protein
VTALDAVQSLREGDECEFRFPAVDEWQAGTVVRNGGSSFWKIRGEDGREHDLYIEYVRAPGQPWW